MASPAETKVFDEVSGETLSAENAVCFLLDEELRITYCNPAWDRFAIENGAPHLTGANVVGGCILDAIEGEPKSFYEALYRKAFSTGEVLSHDFLCSSAIRERLMAMRVHRLRSAPELLTVCSLRVERPHSQLSRPALQRVYRKGDGMIVMCSNCRRTLRAGGRSRNWDWVPDFVEHLPPMVSHGLCGLCLEYYRWGLPRS